jgi:uncharacterized alkaline shock family protein YloU
MQDSQPTTPLPAPGTTVVAEPAVQKVAALAAREVAGVHNLGTGVGRALGALRDAVGGADLVHGVHVEVGRTQVAVDMDVVAEYGYPLLEVADDVRAAVYRAVEQMVGLEVTEVNVEIHDVHVPGLNDPKPTDKPRAVGH